MRGSQPEHRTTCTVAVERNRYGAMTLRSDRGRNYQIVGTECPAISTKLDQLRTDNQVTVTLTKAGGRGNSWRVTGVASVSDCDGAPGTARRQPPKID